MATSSTEVQPRGSVEFVESSILEAVVPIGPDIDIADGLSSWNGAEQDESGCILPFITQRDVILFGTYSLVVRLSNNSLTYAQVSR